jgi:hypothetical protein
MLEQTSRLLLHKLGHHVAQDGSDGKEALVGGANVVEAAVIEEDLLHNKDGDGLAQLGTRLHDPKA